MMIDFYFREPSGKLVMSGSCGESEIDLQSFDGATLEIGTADITKQYFGKNGLTNYPEKPSGYYLFDFKNEAWVLDDIKAVASVLQQRNELLKNGPDRVNPMWWAAMSAAEQADVTAYRQALLDITNQPGYPHSVTWPPIPQVFLPSTGL